MGRTYGPDEGDKRLQNFGGETLAGTFLGNHMGGFALR
jgi:hypothetical protein